jgi:hypothetical protein
MIISGWTWNETVFGCTFIIKFKSWFSSSQRHRFLLFKTGKNYSKKFQEKRSKRKRSFCFAVLEYYLRAEARNSEEKPCLLKNKPLIAQSIRSGFSRFPKNNHQQKKPLPFDLFCAGSPRNACLLVSDRTIRSIPLMKNLSPQ